MQVLKEEIGLAIDLFTWWTVSISWNIFFLIVAGFFLYASSRSKRKEDKAKESEEKIENRSIDEREDKIQFRTKAASLVKDFIFVWILLGLLVFYIFSVRLGTGAFAQTVFAVGNILVEAFLIFYLFRNREKIGRKAK
jgi:high-affinity Fe2+/Pb2+ permease